MLLVDDHLALVALHGKSADLWTGRIPTIPWLCHVRLIRAIRHSRVPGRLTRLAAGISLDAALNPHPRLLKVSDPREFTDATARCHGQRGVSLYAAELLGTAIETEGELHIAHHNFNGHWPSHLAGTGVEVFVYEQAELDAATR